MGLIPKTTCKRCGKEYDEWRATCPHCGARRVKSSQRTTASTVSRKAGTVASARAAQNDKWQKILGSVILILVMLATLALVNVSLNARKTAAEEKAKAEAAEQQRLEEEARREAEAAEQERLEQQQQLEQQTQANTPTVTSITISYYDEPKTEFSMDIGGQIPLKSTVYPLDVTAEVTWSSTDESILTVSEDGLVTGVGSGWAKVQATCGGVTAECTVWVK